MGFVFRLLRNLPPIIYFCLAPVLALLGLWLWYTFEKEDDARRAAMNAPPPAVVTLENFKPNAGADVQEVMLLAQVDVEHTMEMVETKDGREVGVTLFAPLYPADATDTTKPATAIMMHQGTLSADAANKMVDREGTFGPIIKLNGEVSTNNYKFTQSEAKLREAANLAANPVLIEPFVNGRKEGLKPGGAGSIVLAFGLLLGALSAFAGWLRMREVGGLRY